MLLIFLKVLGVIALLLIISYMIMLLGSFLFGLLFLHLAYKDMSEEEKEETKDELGIKRK